MTVLEPAAPARRGKDPWEQLRTRLSKWVALPALLLAGLTQSNWMAHRPGLAAALFGVGLVLVAVASSGRTWCSLYLSGRKDAELTTEGPYSLCRNPLYFFSALGAVGVGLCTKTLFFPLLFLVVFALYYPGIIRREEGRLQALFGASFEAYRASTPRFFPSWRRLREPARWSVDPARFRRHLIDDTMFIWVAALLPLFEGLRQGGWLPRLLHLW